MGAALLKAKSVPPAVDSPCGNHWLPLPSAEGIPLVTGIPGRVQR